MSGKKQKTPYVTIILLCLLVGVVWGTSNWFLTKYILINSDWRAYQELVDDNTENADTLINVNYATLISFIENDSGNSHPYNEAFVCSDFAFTLLHNASLQNISSGFVILNFHAVTEHAIVVFNTTDNGIVYIEPQNDEDITQYITILGVYYTGGIDNTIFSISTYWN